MMLCKVTGTVTMTVKHPAYVGEKLLAVQVLDENQAESGQSILAIDRAQAGMGDTVLVMREGNGIRQIFGREAGVPLDVAVKRDDLPVRSMIVAVVDAVETAA